MPPGSGGHDQSKSKSMSKSRYDSRSVSHCVLVSSHFWFSTPDVCYCLTVIVLFLCGAFSCERSALSFANQTLQYLAVFQYIRKYLLFRCLTYKVMYTQHIQGICPSGLSTAIYTPLIAVHAATAAKFKPLTFPLCGFALPNIANIFIYMIFYICLFSAYFCCVTHVKLKFNLFATDGQSAILSR
jgi:hypothetical protein